MHGINQENQPALKDEIHKNDWSTEIKLNVTKKEMLLFGRLPNNNENMTNSEIRSIIWSQVSKSTGL